MKLTSRISFSGFKWHKMHRGSQSLFVLASTLALLLPMSLAQGQPMATIDEDFHLYLLVGQSNMAGRGKPDPRSKVTDPSILAFDKTGTWVYATDPLHFDKPSVVGVGPGISFAKTLLLVADDKVKIGLIPCAVGGTSIDLWFKGKFDAVTKTHPYDDAIKRAREAMKYGVLKGIIWHQGGSDNTPEKSVGYLQKQIEVIANFRRDLGGPDIPFILGEQGNFKKEQFINRIIRDIPLHAAKVAVVSAEGLTDIGDNMHFDTPSARLLGIRYAEKILSLERH